MPARRPLLVVLAATRDDFERWCLDSGLSRDDPEVIYADRDVRLRGLIDVKVIRVRGWWNHPDLNALEALAQAIEHKSHVQVHVQPDPPHVAEAIRDIRRFGPTSPR